jgi:isohexenylglutaconyl-CoA hydratase
VLAAAGATFAMPEVTLGLPPAQIAPFVAARIGERAALQLMLTGRRIDAAQACAFGLVDEALPADALDARLQAWLADLTRAEPAALRATKAILQRRTAVAETLTFASQAFAAALRSGTAAEGLAAFAAKRPPAWAASDTGAR